MKKRSRTLALVLILGALTTQHTQAQEHARTITGLVTSKDDAAPLEGVMVLAKGTGSSSGTQQDGMYYVQVNDKDSVLVFSLHEFQTQEVKITAGNLYNICLCKGQAQDQPQDKGLRPVQLNGKSPFSPIGNWRLLFQVRPDVEVPVSFDIRATDGGVQKAFFHNADERFEGGRVRQTADSLFIFLDQFDNELAFQIRDNALVGVLKKQDGTGSPLPVKAEPGIDYRFKEKGIKPAGDISGTYEVVFKSEGGKEEKTVGLFHQDGNKLQGTFLRVTGDSRYLEGIVEGNEFYLSSFIGSGPSYYKGSFTPEGLLNGEIIGSRGSQPFSGVRNEKAALPDAYKLTYLKNGYNSFDFSFPDAEGHQVSLKDKKFSNKAVIVTIGGTWCPNCVDETSFLAPWYKANKSRGVEIVSLQYERKTDSAYVRKVLTRFRERYNIEYDLLLGGLADKQGVANSLPDLNTFLAFPTTIFIDRKGKVVQIHTGYSGPATGPYYQQFVKEFNEEVDSLLKN
ncbi:redoxin domain-containing protein [Flavitalea flava]